MANPRLAMFWQDLMKIKSNYDEDDFELGCYVIDKRNNNVEIDGDLKLKRLLFDSAPTINEKWIKDFESAPPSSSQSESVNREKPPGKKCFLDPLPPGGVAGMSDRTVKMYWTTTMRKANGDHKIMGYDTHK